MPELRYKNLSCIMRTGESVLDALLRQGVNVSFSCRMGVCHTCLQRVVEGKATEVSQRGLSEELRALGYFLPCKCVPDEDIAIEEGRDEDLYIQAVVHEKQFLAPDVVRILLDVGRELSFRPGQFINARQPGGVTRSYSLASLPQDYFLEIHVKRKKNGAMSNWIFDSLRTGDVIDIQEPQGLNGYVPGIIDQPLLMVASGTGLAPTLGILREAIACGHQGPIHLYHGSSTTEGLYLHKEMLRISGEHANVRYTGCVSGSPVPEGFAGGRCDRVAFENHPVLQGWHVYLAGVPAMVHSAERRAEEAGAHPAEIHSDPFEYRDLRTRERDGAPDHTADLDAQRRRDPSPDPELWAAMQDGAGLTQVLADFYGRVYEDPLLSPYFEGVTQKRAIEKQYQFMRQLISGEKIYFGDRPRTAHHWMVISDQLFDYREQLMMDCLRRYGLAEHLIRRWRAIEEVYRADIVKSAARPRVVGGVEQPVDGFGRQRLTSATLCDSCGREVDAGEEVVYHLRLGSAYCTTCAETPPPGRN